MNTLGRLSLLGWVLALGACGSLVDSTGTPGSLNVGPAGGTVRAPGNVTLVVPANALPQTTLVVISTVMAPVPLPAGVMQVGQVVQVTPIDLVLGQPATLTMPAPADGVLLTIGGAGAWVEVDGAVFSQGSVTAQVSSLGDYVAASVVELCLFDAGSCVPSSSCTTNAGGGISCTCNPGYAGDGQSCSLITCEQLEPNCGAHAGCSTAFGIAQCACDVGYTGDGITCTPQDCATDNGGCDPDATCSDTSAPHCKCNTGYSGDGFTCRITCAELLPSCGSGATCEDGVDVPAHCVCDPSYFYLDGGEDAGFSCAPQSCNDHNGGCDPNAICYDPLSTDPHFVDGGARPPHCECDLSRGYTGDGLVCCYDGYAQFGASCPVTAVCEVLADGGNGCTCLTGYHSRVGDTQTGWEGCEEDSCDVNNGGCDPNATCSDEANDIDGGNLPDSGAPPHCQCNTGYVGDGYACKDLDECTVAVATPFCDPNASCTNTPGSYTCTCNPGFTGDGKTCAEQTCAMSNGGCNPNATCSDAPDTAHCVCNAGFSGDGYSCTSG